MIIHGNGSLSEDKHYYILEWTSHIVSQLDIEPFQDPSDVNDYPLVNVYITMEHHHAINGKIHYFYGHFQ